jgi:hypothetical protein
VIEHGVQFPHQLRTIRGSRGGRMSDREDMAPGERRGANEGFASS